MSCIYKYKGKDYTKDEFYSLVRTTMVQPRTVQKYKKVLFPTGNTASKVEGHTTLEEFKKEKEDRILYLQKGIAEAEKSNRNGISPDVWESMKNLGITGTLEENIERNRKARLKIINDYTNEINQLKQELERVETEGFGALKPIYNFYENQVSNILKKQGFNPKLITDEYGNTWNEVTVNSIPSNVEGYANFEIPKC